MAKDIDDIQNFACKKKMDFVAASFVQSAEDIRFIRRVLDEAGGQKIKIIAKIENFEGLKNYDEILVETDGIMVARGDLGMEIPSEKVPLAQKWMITKANVAGKFVITATQMLESMCVNPYPTRAEMTDVASAVFDGTDAVMLSGETANGAFPDVAVDTMARLVRSAEIGINHYQNWEFLHDCTAKPVGTVEAIASCASKTATEIVPGLIIAFSEAGRMPGLLAKYKPMVPTVILTTQPDLARRCACLYGIYPYLIDALPQSPKEVNQQVFLAMNMAVRDKLCVPGKEVIVLTSTLVWGMQEASGENEANPERQLYITTAPGRLNFKDLGAAQPASATRVKAQPKTVSLRAVNIDLNMLIKPDAPVRKTKIQVTLGPSVSTVDMLTKCINAGMDVARLNLSHGTPEGNRRLVASLREAAAAKGAHVALCVALSPPIMFTSGVVAAPSAGDGAAVPAKIVLNQDQEVTIFLAPAAEAHANPDAFVGWSDGSKARIGIAWWATPPVLVEDDVIMISDGAAAVRVVGPAAAAGEFTCIAVNSAKFGPKRPAAVEGKINPSMVLTTKEMSDIDFCAEVKPDMIEVSRVQSAEFLTDVKRTLEQAGCGSAQVVAKIESPAGLVAVDEILRVADGIIVARGNLGLRLAPEKVLLASKVLCTKANVMGKPVIISRQILHSMIGCPLPTRAEMTDVANCVIDGADSVMLASETANGDFPVEVVETAAAIVRNAEGSCNYFAFGVTIADYTTRPYSPLESAATVVSESVVDAHASLAVVIDDEGTASRLVSKYRPSVPIVVVTTDAAQARQSKFHFGLYPLVVPEGSMAEASQTEGLINQAIAHAKAAGLYVDGPVAILTGQDEPAARSRPTMRIRG